MMSKSALNLAPKVLGTVPYRLFACTMSCTEGYMKWVFHHCHALNTSFTNAVNEIVCHTSHPAQHQICCASRPLRTRETWGTLACGGICVLLSSHCRTWVIHDFKHSKKCKSYAEVRGQERLYLLSCEFCMCVLSCVAFFVDIISRISLSEKTGHHIQPPTVGQLYSH